MNLRAQAIITLFFVILATAYSPLASAHLMVAQHGTLNIVDDGAFMVLSLPISVFKGVDDDADGHVTMLEFNRHRAAIVETVEQNVTLSDQSGKLPLEGIMLSPEVPHDPAESVITQLVVLGRFSLAEARGSLYFQADLFGKQTSEQRLKITATRQSDGVEKEFELTPSATTESLLF